jgi:opacity protein-like surface antigen
MVDTISAPPRHSPFRVRIALLLTSLATLSVAFSPNAHAQAVYTADRVEGLSAFGTYSRVYTDYGANDYGYTVGADFTRSMRFVSPSIEFRYTGSTGPGITQDSYMGGLKVEKGFHRFHPYADVLIGYGVIHYVPVQQDDNSIIYNVGVGLDYSVTHHFALKVEAQQQFWKLGQASNELEPYNLSVGVLYRVPSFWSRTR